MRETIGWILGLLVVPMAIVPVEAGDRVWSLAGTGPWNVAANWTPEGVPQAGEDVFIARSGAQAIVSASEGYFGSLVVSNGATLVFTNWTTTLSATSVVVGAGGRLTCAGPFTGAQMSNRVSLACISLTVRSNGTIDVNAKGCRGGGPTAAGEGKGGGRSATVNPSGGGGGHGGRGGDGWGGNGAVGGVAYGAASEPRGPGSGGGGGRDGGYGGAGGGAVAIEAEGEVRVDGVISANGQDGYGNYDGGGGSGGAVLIECQTLRGGGTVRANGGLGFLRYSGPTPLAAGGGGGGRIAILCDEASQKTAGLPNVRFSAGAGTRYVNRAHYNNGTVGTLHLSSSNLLSGACLPKNAEIAVPGLTQWTIDALAVNGWLRFLAPGFCLTVVGDVSVVKSDGDIHRLDLRQGALRCGGGIRVSEGALVLDRTSQRGCTAPIPNGGILRPQRAVRMPGKRP
jgi:hypothetical protein